MPSDEALAPFNRGFRPRNPYERSEAFKKYSIGQSLSDAVKTEHYKVTITRDQAEGELGLETHLVTGDVFVTFAGRTLAGHIDVGDVVLSVQGKVLSDAKEYGHDGGLDLAWHELQAGTAVIELAIEKKTLRTERLTRSAALRSTSLDDFAALGLALGTEKRDAIDVGLEMIIVTAISGLARKSGRIVPGDRLVGIDGNICVDMPHALSLLQAAGDEVSLELLYGYISPPKPNGVLRSLSFRKNTRVSPRPKTTVV